jgi:alanine racemase
MALTLTVDRARWQAHVAGVRTEFPDLVPVIKGNGYGFGRTFLADTVEEWAEESDDGGAPRELAVGMVHELAGLARDGPRPIVLTPAIGRDLVPGVGPAILTVGAELHLAQLAAAGLRAPIILKVAGAMQRYGSAPDDLAMLRRTAEAAGIEVHGYAVHPPLAGAPEDHRREAQAVARAVPVGSTIYVSHLDARSYAVLRDAVPGQRWRIRLGTVLWHGDKSFLRLAADVAQVRPVAAGQHAGYRLHEVPGDGHLVMVTAGTAHGIQPRPDGLSPFHFARRRLALLEAPHMHTTMLFVPAGDPLPSVGDHVDVQHPLTRTLVDRIVEH